MQADVRQRRVLRRLDHDMASANTTPIRTARRTATGSSAPPPTTNATVPKRTPPRALVSPGVARRLAMVSDLCDRLFDGGIGARLALEEEGRLGRERDGDGVADRRQRERRI